VYRVTYVDAVGGTNDLVVRVSTHEDVAERVQAEREATVLKKLQGVGAPRLYDFRNESRWFDTPTMCMQFIEGEHRELMSAPPADVQRLGEVVASVHNLPVDDLADCFPGPNTTAAYVDGWLELIASYLSRLRDPLPRSVRSRVERAQSLVSASLERALSAESRSTEDRLVLLHGDVGPGNILWSEQPVLIDWEYARLGDPADEIAYIFGQHGLASSQREAFWSGYRRATTHLRLDHVVERVRWWEPVTLLGSALWWLERWSRRADADAAGDLDPSAAKPQSYYLDNVLLRLDRFDVAVTSEPGSRR
jgi:aminoglycoside phosphotransferase (APT) family kinase protein